MARDEIKRLYRHSAVVQVSDQCYAAEATNYFVEASNNVATGAPSGYAAEATRNHPNKMEAP